MGTGASPATVWYRSEKSGSNSGSMASAYSIVIRSLAASITPTDAVVAPRVLSGDARTATTTSLMDMAPDTASAR